jgi:uncharacterized protein
MNEQPGAPRTGVSSITWVGLFIALFGMLLVRQAINFHWPSPTFDSALAKELGNWLCAAVLILIIAKGERLPFTSIGIGTAPLGKSLLWGLALAFVSLVAGGLVAHLTQYGHRENATVFDKLPTWLVTLIVIRAGVVEELFYRGYAIERLTSLGLNRYVAAAVPLLIFAVGHWTGGAANILIALVIGAILSAFYLWRRDLVANMFAHFLVDFIANVLPRLFGGNH